MNSVPASGLAEKQAWPARAKGKRLPGANDLDFQPTPLKGSGEPAAVHGAEESANDDPPSEKGFSTSFDSNPLLIGIAVAGFIYPWTVYVLVSAGVLVSNLWNQAEVTDLAGVLVLGFAAAAASSLYASFWALLAAIFVLWTIRMIARTAGGKLSPTWIGGFAGGVSGVLGVGVFVDFSLNEVVWLALGPGLATLVGQAGGAVGGLNGLTHAGQRPLMFEGCDGAITTKTQFSLRQVLVLTGWVCALLAVLGLAGLLKGRSGWLLLGWFCLQAVSLPVVVFAARRFVTWRRAASERRAAATTSTSD